MADDDIQVTEYGGSVPGDQPGGETYDYNSYHGIGDRQNALVPGLSVALTPEEREARFGTSGKSTGREFEYEGKTYRDDDTAAQYFKGRDEGKRIDDYQGGGSAGALGRVRSEGSLGPENLLGATSDYSGAEPSSEIPGVSLDPATSDQEAEAINTESPYEAWRRNNPLLADVVPKEKVISDMHASIAPEMDPGRFGFLAEQPNGYQAIKNIQNKVSPLQQWRKDHPEFAFYTDEDVSKDTYNKMVQQGRINPAQYDYGAFLQVFNPQNPVAATTYNVLKGISEEGAAGVYKASGDIYAAPENLKKWMVASLDAAFPGYGFSNKPGETGGGTKIVKLADAANDWLTKNVPGNDVLSGFWPAVSGWLTSQAQSQRQQEAAAQERAGLAEGVAGEAGRLVGGTAAELATQAPIFAPFGTPQKAAAVLSTMYLGATGYGDAIQAGEDNALLKGFESAASGPMFGYLVNSPIGRLKTGFLNFVMNSGQDQVDRMMKGQKSNWSEFAEHSAVDILLGIMMGKSADKGPYSGPDLRDLYYEPLSRPDNEKWRVEIPKGGGIPPEAHEALLDAADARARGDYKGAAEGLDKAMAILNPKERQEIASRVISTVASESPPGLAGQKHNEHYFGVTAIRGNVPQDEDNVFPLQQSEVSEPSVLSPVQGGLHEDVEGSSSTSSAKKSSKGQVNETAQERSLTPTSGEDQTVSAEPSGVSQEEERSTLASALAYTQGDVGPDQQPSADGQGEVGEGKKKPAIVRWAEQFGKLLNWDDLKSRLVEDTDWPKHGAYHMVYIHPDDPGRVLKTRADKFGDDDADHARQLNDYHLMNQVFGSDITLDGVAVDKDGVTHIVSSMPFIEGGKPEMEDIAAFMESHGFHNDGRDQLRWVNDSLGIAADDAHEGNFIKDRDGNLHPIDLMMEDLQPKPKKGESEAREILSQGPVTAARQANMDPVWMAKLLTDSELKLEINRYHDLGKQAQKDVLVKEWLRRKDKQRGQGGFIVIPGAERIQKFFDAALEPLRDFGDWWHMTLDPEKLGPGALRAANIARRENVIAANAEDVRNWIANHHQVDVDLRGAQKIQRRRNEFNQFSNEQLKQWLINWDEKKPIKVPNKKQQGTFDYMFWLYRTAYKAMQQIEHKIAGFGYSIRDNYMYHAIAPKDKERFAGFLQSWGEGKPGWNPDPKFTKLRELPTWREVFAAGFEPRSYNFEDLFQMRLNAHTEALKRVRELRQLRQIGLAFLKNPKPQDIEERRQEMGLPNTSDGLAAARQTFKIPDSMLHGKEWSNDWRAPNGEEYLVERNAAALLTNAWDQKSFYTSTNVPLRWYFKGMSALKGIGANILTWSLFHPKHILFTSLTNYLWDWAKSAGTGKPWNAQEAWSNAIKASGFGAVPELDYFQNRRAFASLSDEQKQNVDAIRWMGLNFGINQERAMQWGFGRQIAETFPKLRHTLNMGDKITAMGFHWLTLQPVQEWMFGRLIPQLKIADALRDHAQLLKDHPEYVEPDHAEAYHTQLGAMGKALEAKYGEMFLDNLFWKKTTKEIWTAHLLSLGWQLSAIRVYAGAAKDLVDNSAALMGLRQRTDNPALMNLVSDRMGHLGMYLGMYMLTNAAISWTNGYSQGKRFESKDLWFPVIGKNLPGSPDPWIRAAPGEFNRELAVLYMHIMAEGGGALGTIYGTANYGVNKLQPVASSFKQAFIDQKNFFGADIGGEPVDDQMGRIADKLEYMVANSTLPIPFKQQLQAKPGETEGVSAQGFIQNPLAETQKAASDLFRWPTLWSMMGYPQAGAYVGRSDVQNIITTEYGRRFGGGTKIQDQVAKTQAYEAYREALSSGDESAIEKAVTDIHKLGKEQHFNANKAIESVRRNALKGITADQYMFSRFDRNTQDKILQRASPEERLQYQKFLHHE